jgi:hypothetical protein
MIVRRTLISIENRLSPSTSLLRLARDSVDTELFTNYPHVQLLNGVVEGTY